MSSKMLFVVVVANPYGANRIVLTKLFVILSSHKSLVHGDKPFLICPVQYSSTGSIIFYLYSVLGYDHRRPVDFQRKLRRDFRSNFKLIRYHHLSTGWLLFVHLSCSISSLDCQSGMPIPLLTRPLVLIHARNGVPAPLLVYLRIRYCGFYIQKS